MHRIPGLVDYLEWDEKLNAGRTDSQTFNSFMPKIVSKHVFTTVPHFRWIKHIERFLLLDTSAKLVSSPLDEITHQLRNVAFLTLSLGDPHDLSMLIRLEKLTLKVHLHGAVPQLPLPKSLKWLEIEVFDFNWPPFRTSYQMPEHYQFVCY